MTPHRRALAEVFQAHAPAGTVLPEDRAQLETSLAAGFETAREPWPGLALSAEQFIRHVAEHLPVASRGQPVELVLKELHLSDLYLACACAGGEPGAISILERDYLAKVPGVLRPWRMVPEMVEDVCQKLREKLLIRGAHDRHIATYTGDGKLGSWIEIIAKRMATKETRSKGARSTDVSKIIDNLPGKGDLEKRVVSEDLLAEFRWAVRAAASELTDEQRQLLRFYYEDGLSQSELAGIFNTSQPTIVRRLERARKAIGSRMEELLRGRLRLTESEFQSFIDNVRSQWLDVSLSQLFEHPDTPSSSG